MSGLPSRFHFKQRSVIKPKSQSSSWISHLNLLSVTSMRRMGYVQKLLIKLVALFFAIATLSWYIDLFQTRDPPSITINYETWKKLQIGAREINVDKELNQDSEINSVDLMQPQQNAVAKNSNVKSSLDREEAKPAIKVENRAPVQSQNSVPDVAAVSGKEQEILGFLRNPPLKLADPSAPMDCSYSIIKNGVREPLEDNEPVMLVWWPPEYLLHTKENFLEREFQGICGKCRLTTDRSLLARSNVVIFDNVPMKTNLEDLPPASSRRPDQAYVLWHRETPAKTFHLKELMRGTFDKMFNYTMSYRRDADVIWYLGNSEFVKRSKPPVFQRNPQSYVDQIVNGKRHLAVWVVSNCNKTKGAVARMDYTQELVKAGLKIDLYGKCFGNMAPHKDFYEFLRPYKFYLAFENSWHCKDYLTEKFWRNGLMANVVPVLWGPSREDVKAVAPANSYIHAEDFESPAELVKYLRHLDEDEAAYRKYFDWHFDPIPKHAPVQMLRPGYEPGMCKICRALNENNGRLPHKVLKSSIDWVFIDGDDSQCLLLDLEQ